MCIFRMYKLIFTDTALADQFIPPPQGDWSQQDNRTLSQPFFSTEGNTLLIYFPKAIDGANICIADEHGNVVYDTLISCEADETYAVPVQLLSGKGYQFVFNCDLGILYGSFIAE